MIRPNPLVDEEILLIFAISNMYKYMCGNKKGEFDVGLTELS